MKFCPIICSVDWQKRIIKLGCMDYGGLGEYVDIPLTEANEPFAVEGNMVAGHKLMSDEEWNDFQEKCTKSLRDRLK